MWVLVIGHVVAGDEGVVKGRDSGFIPFETWKKSPHQGCTSFSGCLTMEDREVYLNPNSTSIPCGFMYPSDLEKVREYFQRDKTCKVVLFSVLFGAHSFAYNPLSSTNFLEEDENICMFLFVDEVTLMNGHGIWQLAPGQQNWRGIHWSSIVGGESTWQLILIKDVGIPNDRGGDTAKSAIKLSGLQLFPNAEWVIYIDTKFIVNSNPKQLTQYVEETTNHSIAAYAHFRDPVRKGFKAALGDLYIHSVRKNNEKKLREYNAINNQYQLYDKEGLFKIYDDSNRDALVDSAILIARNDNRARRFFCSWLNEVSLFSKRDRLSFHTVQHHLQIFTHQIWPKEMFGGNNQFVKALTGLKPYHPPSWNMYNDSNPHPFLLHPSTSVDTFRYPSFKIWKKSPHSGCKMFSGCLTIDDRVSWMNPNAASIPCGFMHSSDLDKVRTYFEKDRVCKIVLFSVLLGAHGYAYNPLSLRNYLIEDRSVCLFLFIDEETLMNGHGLKQLAPGQQNWRGMHWSAIVGGEYTWKLILIKNWGSAKRYGATLTKTIIKLSGLQLFPNAEWVIYVDTKYVLNGNPKQMTQYVEEKTNHSIAAYAHFRDPVRKGFKAALGHLYIHSVSKKNEKKLREYNAIDNQYQLYEKEGLFEIYNDSNRDALVDSAILIARNDNRARRFFCSWLNEVSLFSKRDQLSFHTVQHHLQIFTHQIWPKEMFGRNQFVKGLQGFKPYHPPIWNMYNDSNPHPFSLHPSTSNSVTKINLRVTDAYIDKRRDEEFPNFDMWVRSPHEGCASFSGCLTLNDRKNFLKPKATSLPCGFLYPSDLDKVREFFENDKTCKIVLFSLLLGAYNFVYNPISPTNFLEEDKSICMFLFVDEITLMNGHGIWQLAPGQENKHRVHKSAIVGGNSTWQLILIKNFAAPKGHSTAHVAKLIKLNGLRLFPNAEWVIYVDTKYAVTCNPQQIIGYVEANTDESIAAYAHFKDPIRKGFKGAIGRLYIQNSTRKNDNLLQEIRAVEDQYNLYEKEGLFGVYPDSNRESLIDSAILIAHNDNRARRFFCSWQNEVSMFSRRDQLAFHSVQHHLQIYTYQIWPKQMFGYPNRFIKGLSGIKPAQPPRWNLFNTSNPHPFRLHPSTM